MFPVTTTTSGGCCNGPPSASTSARRIFDQIANGGERGDGNIGLAPAVGQSVFDDGGHSVLKRQDTPQ